MSNNSYFYTKFYWYVSPRLLWFSVCKYRLIMPTGVGKIKKCVGSVVLGLALTRGEDNTRNLKELWLPPKPFFAPLLQYNYLRAELRGLVFVVQFFMHNKIVSFNRAITDSLKKAQSYDLPTAMPIPGLSIYSSHSYSLV